MSWSNKVAHTAIPARIFISAMSMIFLIFLAGIARADMMLDVFGAP